MWAGFHATIAQSRNARITFRSIDALGAINAFVEIICFSMVEAVEEMQPLLC